MAVLGTRVEDLEDHLPTMDQEAMVAGLEDTGPVDTAVDRRGAATVGPLVVDLVGMVRLVAGTAVAEDIAGTSSVKGLVGTMTGMPSALDTSLLRFPFPFDSQRHCALTLAVLVGRWFVLYSACLFLPCSLLSLPLPVSSLFDCCLRKYHISHCMFFLYFASTGNGRGKYVWKSTIFCVARLAGCDFHCLVLRRNPGSGSL